MYPPAIFIALPSIEPRLTRGYDVSPHRCRIGGEVTAQEGMTNFHKKKAKKQAGNRHN